MPLLRGLRGRPALVTTQDLSRPAGPALRVRGAWLAALGGGALLAFAGWTAWLAEESDVRAAGRLAACGLALWIVGVAVASPLGRRRAVTAATAVVVALLAVEAGLSAFAGAYYEPPYRLNDEWHYEYRPGLRRTGVFVQGGERVSVPFDLNADGYRGPELLPKGAAKRVVVFGDSFVASVATKLEETFVRQLGRDLADGLGAPVEDVNAGVGGFGPDQALLRMRAELPRLHADLVVVSVLAQNDYGDILRNRLVGLGPDGELRMLRAAMSESMRATFDAPSLTILRALTTLRQRFEMSRFQPLSQADLARMHVLACESEHRGAVAADPEVLHPFWDHPDEDLRVEPQSESARYKVAIMRKVIEAIRDAAASNGAPLVLVVIPAANDVCRGYDPEPVDLTRHPDYRPRNLARPIEEAAEALGVPHVDLFDAFVATDANALYFHDGDTHWNAAGQALAARLTADRVRSLGLLTR